MEHFTNIFKASRATNSIHWDDHMDIIKGPLSSEALRILNEPFSTIEIKEALFQMNPPKAPGPDGFTALFFQKFWHIVGHVITQKILIMLNDRKLEAGLNEPVITLIPKVKHASILDDYRHISLCNVVSKIISKVLANRLKFILREMVLEFQSAFIPGSLISDNYPVAHAVSHFIKSRRVQK